MGEYGLQLLESFSAAKIFAGIIFSTIGFVAFIYGRRNKSYRPMIIGVALMAYPYFVSGTFLLYFIGIVLTVTLYFWR